MAMNITPYDVTTNNVVNSTNLGAEVGSVSGSYNGTSNQQYTIKVAQTDTYGNVTGIQVSTDGGQTYGSTISASSTPAQAFQQTSFNLGNGLTYTVTPGQADQNKAVIGDTFNFVATAAGTNGGTGTNLLQLQYTDANSNTYNMGTAQMLQAGQTFATLGSGNSSMTVGFGAYGASGSVGSGNTTVTTNASSSAVVGANDLVIQNAVSFAGLNVTTQASASQAVSTIDSAINLVSSTAAKLGAIANRLQDTIANLNIGSENLSAAYSQVMDTNVAQTTVQMTTDQIKTQAGVAVLAQANQLPQLVLKLLP